MQQLSAFLHEFPALCLFLSILLGAIIGRFHFKGVGFGAVVGTLIAGIVIGILAKPELPDLLRWAFFYLFLFSIGYSVGPQFFGSLKKDAAAADHAGAGRRRQRPGHRDRRLRGLRFRRRSGRGAAVGRHDPVGGARHRPQRDRRVADSRSREDHAHRQRAARGRDYLRVRRPRPDPVPHVARSEDHAGGSQERREGARTAALRRQEQRPDLFRRSLQSAGLPRRERRGWRLEPRGARRALRR